MNSTGPGLGKMTGFGALSSDDDQPGAGFEDPVRSPLHNAAGWCTTRTMPRISFNSRDLSKRPYAVLRRFHVAPISGHGISNPWENVSKFVRKTRPAHDCRKVRGYQD